MIGGAEDLRKDKGITTSIRENSKDNVFYEFLLLGALAEEKGGGSDMSEIDTSIWKPLFPTQ
jgi:hypothetical protein